MRAFEKKLLFRCGSRQRRKLNRVEIVDWRKWNMIYLDNAATTQPEQQVVETMVEMMTAHYGNPSSLHRLGIHAEKSIKQAREQIAKKLKVKAKNIIFTSGGTESNNLAILGYLSSRYHGEKIHCITTQIEHPSVLNVFKQLEEQGVDVTYLPVSKRGLVALTDLKASLKKETVLVSTMCVNNEIGTIQPIQEISQTVKAFNPAIIVHVDAIQALGTVDLGQLVSFVDLLSISSHKIHGPKGVGALYAREGVRLHSLMYGGGQEAGLRNGTENVPGIVGFGTAVSLLDVNKNHSDMMEIKRKFFNRVASRINGIVLNGPSITEGAPHILSIGAKNIKAEVIQHMLEAKDIYVGTGSACASHKKGMSHVLKAIGTEKSVADGTLRISFSKRTTIDECEQAANVLADSMIQFLRMVKK